MQQLPDANISPDRNINSAKALLWGLPHVVWFIRFHMRKNSAHGLSVPQFRALAQLASLGTQNVSAIADNLGCSLPTASRMIDKLVDLKLIEREQCKDNRRKVSLTLTVKGREVFESASRRTEEAMADVLKKLDDKDHQDLARLMPLLREIFNPHAISPSPDRTRAKT